MNVYSLTSAEEFLAKTEDLRSNEPVLTNVMGSIAAGVVAGRQYETCRWWIAESDGQVVGAALRTAPYQVVLSPMPRDAVSLLANTILEDDPDFPGVSGPITSVEGFVRATRIQFSDGMDQLIYVLDQLRNPTTPGLARESNVNDVDLILKWHEAFVNEAGLLGATDIDYLTRNVSEGRYMLWELDGSVVSMASNAPVITSGNLQIGRVGPVYTPPEQRRRGYGAAITAAVTERLKRNGCTTVMLYTDAQNPISNSIYQQIGYVQVDQWVEKKRS